jgi:hypothetical protein
MMSERNVPRKRLNQLALLAAAIIVAGPCLALDGDWGPPCTQARQARPNASQERPKARRAPHGQRGDRAGRGDRRRFGRGGPGGMFRPAPRDHRPLEPGEGERLMDFAREHALDAYRWLNRIREERPAEFPRHLQKAAPQLRHLMRIYERDPELVPIIIERARHWRSTQRLLRGLEKADTPELRGRIERELREHVAASVEFEIGMRERRLESRIESREDEIKRRLGVLTAPDVDLARQPDDVRALVAQFQAAANAQKRQSLEDELREVLARHVDAEIETWRQRIEGMRSRVEKIVDGKLRRLLESGADERPERERRRPRRRRP